MAKTLEAHDKLIREIFEGSYQFEIPDYQRPYARTTEQATELFDDLYSAMQDARVSGASRWTGRNSARWLPPKHDPGTCASQPPTGGFFSFFALPVVPSQQFKNATRKPAPTLALRARKNPTENGWVFDIGGDGGI